MPTTALPLLQTITWGTQVSSTDISVHFVASGTTLGGYTAESFSASDMAQFRALFDIIEAVANLHFTITDDSGAMFRLVNDTNEVLGDFDGVMGPPGETDAGIGVFDGSHGTHGVVSTRSVGGYDFMVMGHELLHGLGLAHPHDDGGSSTVMRGVTDSDDHGNFNLNQGIYTTMTYNNGFVTGEAGATPPDSRLFGYEAGPMALDIAVLQALYGANTSTGAGNTIYDLPGSNDSGTYWMSLWDTGGNDAIRYTGDGDVTIDLRPATLTYGNGGGGYLSHVTGIAGGYTVANGVVIERAIGGSGDDRLIGNDANNRLLGRGGDDTLKGKLGDDWLHGRGGIDRLVGGVGDDILLGGRGTDRLIGQAGDDVLDGGRDNDTLAGQGGADTFVFSRGSGRDAVLDFQDDIDTLQLNSRLWNNDPLSVSEVLDFARVIGNAVHFVFDTGDRLVLRHFTDISALSNDISIV